MPPSIMSALADLFPDTVSVTTVSGEDALGAKTYSAAADFTARCTMRETKVRGADGQETVSRVMVLFATATTFTLDDLFTLPSRFDVRTPKPLAITYGTDENGAHHQRIYF